MNSFLFHFHGIGNFDFSALEPADLPAIDDEAGRRGWTILPTVYLRPDYLDRLTEVMAAFAAGSYPSTAGFAMEGPLLGPAGGIPPQGCWYPTRQQWGRIGALGRSGLRYIVMGPDAMDLNDELDAGFTFRDLISELYGNGVILAIGHFRRDDPERSARRTRQVIEFVQDSYGPSPHILTTDHLFNDMPRNFVHAWRTPESRERRDVELEDFLSREWTDDTIDDLLGVVPATIIRAARRGLLTVCLNFDGEHVDIEIQSKAARYVGASHLIAMTDNTETDMMAGEPLYDHVGSGLRWRRDGLVAAGSGGIDVQLRNLRSSGFDEDDIARMTDRNARDLLAGSQERLGAGHAADPLTTASTASTAEAV